MKYPSAVYYAIVIALEPAYRYEERIELFHVSINSSGLTQRLVLLETFIDDHTAAVKYAKGVSKATGIEVVDRTDI